MKMKRIEDLSFEQMLLKVLTPVNFLLSLLIVFHHAFTVDVGFNGSFSPLSYGFTVAFQRLMYNFSECAVPIFFFLSAFLFYRTFDGSWDNYKKKITRRFWSLLVPYIIFCSFGYLKHLIATDVGDANIVNYIRSLWICDTMPLWFIRELIALSILAPVFWYILKKPFLLLFIILIVLVMASFGVIPYRSFVYWIPVYLLGALVNNYKLKIILSTFAERCTDSFALLFLLFYILCTWYLPNGIKNIDMTFFQNLFFILLRTTTPVLFIPIIFCLSKRNIKERSFMKYSFFVYCMHFPVITILGIILDRFMVTSLNIELVKYFFIVGLTYTLCVLLAMGMQRFTPAIWGILNGHRK